MSMNNLDTNTYNPDVLTCLANLSNDEVFTPPDIANKMLDLLPQELFNDRNTTFLDPACKSGVFLREIAKRLIVGLDIGGCTDYMKRPLLENNSDIFIRYNKAISIIRKTTIPDKRTTFSKLVSTSRPFGFRTYFRDFTENAFSGAIKIYTSAGCGYIEKSRVEMNIDWIDKWKVFIAGAYGERIAENFWVTGKPFIGEPGSCCTETYFVIGPFDTKEQCENVVSYITTRFFRFLVHLHKNTQHATAKVYSFVPIQDFTESWSDEKLYAQYGLSEDEITFIESMIRPMEINGDTDE